MSQQTRSVRDDLIAVVDSAIHLEKKYGWANERKLHIRVEKKLNVTAERAHQLIGQLIKEGVLYYASPGQIKNTDLALRSSNNGDPAVTTEAPEHPESTSSPRLKGKQQSRTAGTRPIPIPWTVRQSLTFRKLHELEDRLNEFESRLKQVERER